ncbi:hypothetical protein SeMB42_g07212 [Synchytrium endobioticum]|uniref:ENTH domain-containing protein n=1 Tax=Synchytrium endobioticum TaxID=286115 RepID=A0A507DDC7_9FUNG|nr:hypothetical protein SeMB42_g07212 [Synchytrium endobioticum]TPX49411.1 hypothetical protein SeLEV6574_g01499 [Synchytrium endobioticum]
MTDSVKSVIRSVKNYAKGYSDVQIKVRQATSNDPWGPSGTLMAELADATFNARDFQEIMEMIDKRLNDHGKNWRHVFKSLTLLDYLLHSGSEAVIQYAKDNIYIIRTLKEFQFVDEEGKDQGANVRQKSKDITALLGDEARLKEERAARLQMRDRVRDEPSGTGVFDEEEQLKRALEESKRTAARDELRRKEGMTDLELQRTLELLAEREQVQLEQRRIANQLTGGSTFSFENASPVDEFDPFQPKWGGSKDAKPIGSTYNPFAFENDPQAKQRSPPMNTSGSANHLNSLSLIGTSNPIRPQLTGGELMSSTFPVEPFRNPTGPTGFGGISGVGNSTGFVSAFDGGLGSKHMPFQGVSDANARLADVARNSSQIDPFANLAAGRTSTTNQFGSGGTSNFGNGAIGNMNGPNPFGTNPTPSNYNTIGFRNTSSADENPFAATPGAGALVVAGSSAPFRPGSSSIPSQSTSFGQSAFGQSQPSGGPFGGPNNPFGGAQTSTPFGTTSASQPFGASSGYGGNQPFAGAPLTSQQQSNPFGMGNNMSSGMNNAMGSQQPFGNTGGYGSSNIPFGQSNNGFGLPQQQQHAFGQPNVFGQPHQQQQPFGQPFGNQRQQPFSNTPYGQQSLF